MATRNGSYQNHARIEWVYTVGSVGPNTTSVSVQVTAYLRMQSGYSINGNWPVSWSGSWGSSSNTQSMNLSGGQRKQVRTYSTTVTLTDSSQSRSYQIGVSHFWGSTSDTLNVTIPARYPNAPTNPQINLLSDDEIRVAWTRQGTYTSVGIQRQTDTGSWSGRGAALGNAGDWTDTWVDPNRRYRYRFQGRNSQGSSPWSTPTEYIYTRPARVTGVTATRNGSGISVDATGLTPWATSYDIESDQDGIVGSQYARTALPFVHTDPNPAVPHRYRVRARVYSGGNDASWLVGPWSAWSNTVQLIQPPNAPTNLSPNGTIVDLAKNVTFSWRHNSVDSSPQSSAQIRYRLTGESSWRTVSVTTAQSWTGTLSDQFGGAIGAGTVEWQVRTKGAHPDFSPWSALASLTLIDAPTVAILQPESIHRSTTVTAQWNYSQAQDRPQSNWQVQLVNSDTGVLVESRSGSGAVSSLNMNARLEPDTNYLVRVRAATGSVWSDWAEMPFVTEFVPPREPIVEGEWDEETGSYSLTIEDADCVDDGVLYQNLVPNPSMESASGTVEVVRNLVTNPRMGATSGTVVVRRNLITNPSFEVNTAGWSPVRATLERITTYPLMWDGARSGDAIAEVVANVGSGGAYIWAGDYALGGLSWVGVSALAATEAGVDVRLQVIWRNSGGQVSITSSPYVPAQFYPGARLVHAFEAPATATHFRVVVAMNANAVGDRLWVDSVIADTAATEESALTAVETYFDGSTTSPDPDLTPNWLGTPGESESVLTGVGVANLSAGATNWTSQPYQITEPDGSKAARFVTSTASLIGVPVSNVSTPVGVTRTVLFQVRPSVDILARPRVGGALGTDYETIPTGQWTTIRHTGTSTNAIAAQTGLVVTGNTPGNFIDIRYVMLAEGEYNGEYMDGSTASGPDLTASWVGAANASASVLTGVGVANLSRWSASSSLPWQITDDPYEGEYAARFQINTTASISVPIGSVSLPAGTRATAVAAVRPPRDMRMGIRIGGSPIYYEDVIGGQWNVLRRTDVSESNAAAASRLVWPPNQFEVGDWLDVDAAMIVPVEEGEEYTGPYHDGDDVGWGWDGEPNASASRELERPASTSVVIERSIDGGDTWEHVTEASFEDCTLSVSDFEGLSCGTTLYRITNYAETGASIDVVHEGLADSQAIWLGTGEGFVQTARISLHDGVGISRGRERSLEHYQGRSLGVAYMSENLHRTVSVQGMVPDTDMLRCPSVTRDELERIITYPYPVHLHRDMHGNRVYGIAGNIGLDREWLMAHRDCGDHQGMCGLGLWTFQYDIDETESR